MLKSFHMIISSADNECFYILVLSLPKTTKISVVHYEWLHNQEVEIYILLKAIRRGYWVFIADKIQMILPSVLLTLAVVVV